VREVVETVDEHLRTLTSLVADHARRVHNQPEDLSTDGEDSRLWAYSCSGHKPSSRLTSVAATRGEGFYTIVRGTRATQVARQPSHDPPPFSTIALVFYGAGPPGAGLHSH
jgi:hypothetical protein